IRRRWAVGATALAFLFALFPTAVTTLASTLVLDRWHLSVSDLRPWHFLVWLIAVSGFFVSGRLLDRWGRRPTSMLFLAAATAAGAFAFTATSTPARVLGLALVIFTLTGATPCVAAYSTELFPPGARGRVGAWLRGMSIAGQAAAPALATAVAGRVNGEGVLLLGGPRALLMQIAHPSVAAGVADHSDFPAEPYRRLWRTMDAMLRVSFGESEQSREAAEQVTEVHRRVAGRRRDGVAYRAMEPDL